MADIKWLCPKCSHLLEKDNEISKVNIWNCHTCKRVYFLPFLEGYWRGYVEGTYRRHTIGLHDQIPEGFKT